MSSLLRFEGRTQEEARRKIRERLGGDACIVRAGKERSGGLFGFFQREVYVFEVSPATSRPRTQSPAEPVAQPDAGLAPILAAAIEASESTFSINAPLASASFESSFEEVLSEAQAAIAGADEPRPERAAAEPALSPMALADAIVSEAGTNGPSFWETSTTQGGIIEAGCYARPDDAPLTDLATVSTAAEIPDATARIGAAPAPAEPSVAAPPPEQPPSGGGMSFDALHALGLAQICSGSEGELTLDELLRALEALPRAPRLPSAEGSLVLVIGRRPVADRLARRLAGALGPPAERLACATLGSDRPSRSESSTAGGRRPVLGPLGLSHLVAERRMEGRSSVLSLALPARCNADELATCVRVLRPDACWAALAADSTPEELDELRQATGRLDAIALEGFSSAERPGLLIGGGVPVAYVDGHRANPLLFAALIAEQLERRVS